MGRLARLAGRHRRTPGGVPLRLLLSECRTVRLLGSERGVMREQ